MRIKRNYLLVILLALGVCLIPYRLQVRQWAVGAFLAMKEKKTIADRLAEFGDAARLRLASCFKQAAVSYPPTRVSLVGLKTERTLQVWVAGPDGKWKYLKDYPILGMSGILGPKLNEGDMQVPEGLYRVESLNPNSLYHVALRVNYPNAEDRKRGNEDGRTKLGSDIMIHGKKCSIGCLAMGDETAEELFTLAADAGIENVFIILSPVDFRVRNLPKDMPPTPAWTQQLYDTIRQALKGM